MGQQHRKETKRRRRTAFIKRQKEQIKINRSAGTTPLAKKVVKDEAKKTPAKKAPAKKAPAKKDPVAAEATQD